MLYQYILVFPSLVLPDFLHLLKKKGFFGLLLLCGLLHVFTMQYTHLSLMLFFLSFLSLPRLACLCEVLHHCQITFALQKMTLLSLFQSCHSPSPLLSFTLSASPPLLLPCVSYLIQPVVFSFFPQLFLLFCLALISNPVQSTGIENEHVGTRH